MRKRPSARLIVLNRDGYVLLFRFEYKRGALAGQEYWGTPGGALEDGETFEDAARRELLEETGIEAVDVLPHISEREFVLQTHDGDNVMAEERYFAIKVADQTLSTEYWTELETEVMVEHRWWSLEELLATQETIFPQDIADMLKKAMDLFP